MWRACAGWSCIAIATGRATGVVWPDGHVALRWMAEDHHAVSSTSLWSSVADLLRVHGHRGDSEVVYLDSESAGDDVAAAVADLGRRRGGWRRAR